MIWIGDKETAGEDLAAYVESEMGHALRGRADEAREAAGALAAFIGGRHANEALPGEYLLLLMARVLWVLGGESLAQRFVEEKGAEWRAATGFAGAAAAPSLSVEHWRFLLGARAVRPLTSMAFGVVWIIDLRRLVAEERSGLELVFFRVLKGALEQVAAVWDNARGGGALGLRRAGEAAELFGCPRASRKNADMADEIRRHCESSLRAIAAARGWERCPEVIGICG